MSSEFISNRHKRHNLYEKSPCCDRSNKDGKFAPLEDGTGGYCHSCGEMFFSDSGEKKAVSFEYKEPEPSFLPFSMVEAKQQSANDSNFVKWLYSIFPEATVKRLIQDFYLGSSTRFNNGVIFWLIDQNNKVRSGKVQKYKKDIGKRDKTISPDWIHAILRRKKLIKDFQLVKTLYGIHRVKNNELIAVCESEKTSIAMQVFAPDYTWVATGGKSNKKLQLFRPLKGKTIVIFPDVDGVDEWEKMKDNLIQDGHYAKISPTMMQYVKQAKEHQKNWDILDFILDKKGLYK